MKTPMSEASTESASPELRREALRALIQFDLFVALIIFLAAWSLRFWQGWLFWIVFSASVWWITLYLFKHDPHLLEARMKAGPSAEQETSQKIIQAFAGVLAAALVILPGLDHHFGWSSVPAMIVVIADAFVALSFMLVFRVFRENSFAASTIKVESKQRLISTGPYAIVRHPMYSGASLGIIATPIALGSWWGVLVGFALVIAIIVRLLDEERYLAANLPGYDEYRRQVSYRLVPMVW
jgi:protein-S-isoprenylcysteine O-methyltransferase Ste14